MTMAMHTVTESPTGDAAHPHILVAGLGNSILMDDGIGVHATLALQDTAEPGVCAAEIGTAVLDGLHLFEWADKILAIDAMEAGGRPGDIYLIEESGLAGGGPIQASMHELSLKAALRFTQQPVAGEIVILGVEPAEIDYGLELTPPLQAALPRVATLARRIVQYWRDQSSCDAGSLEQLVAEVLAEPVV